MVEFTLIELHVEDFEFGDAPFARSGGRSATASTTGDARSDDEGGSGILSKVLGVLVIAAAVYAARRFMGGGDDGGEPEFAAEDTTEPLAAD